MRNPLLALTVLGAVGGAFSGIAQAQSYVTVYGNFDVGVKYKSNTSTATAVNPTTKTTVASGDNDRLGFKGSEDLGNGLKALFQLEIRFDPDTGTVEAGSRPLFQGESRVGLAGDFGTVRIGRGLTPMHATNMAFEPWSYIPNRFGFAPDVLVAGYTSDPLSATGNSKNRFSNAVFYNSPVFGGFQLNAAVATKEANSGAAIVGLGTTALPQYAAGAEASATPFSVTATWTQGPLGVMAAYERNAVETKYMGTGIYWMITPALKVMLDYSRQDQGHTVLPEFDKTSAWVLGANYDVALGKLRAGYGQKRPDGLRTTKLAAVGYEHNLSKRTYLYVDAANKKDVLSTTVAPSYNAVDFGIHHNF
jgi:predicted porin